MAYPNGQIPAHALKQIPGSNAGLLRPAALAYSAMHYASLKVTGVSLHIVDGQVGRTYRSFARQVLAKRIYGSNAATPGGSNHGLGLAVDLMTTAQRAAIDRVGAAFGWAKKWSDACVPLDTRILTRRGWLTWDQVEDGDETLGYNPETQMGEWTPITAVNRQEGDLLVHEHSRLRLEATAGHRWLTPGRGYGPAELLTIGEIDASDPQARILLAAPAEGGTGLPITTEEAALLGWALTDGSIYRSENSRGTRAYARVYQKKVTGVAVVDELMEHFPHTRFEDWTGEGSHSPGCTAWYVGRGTFSPIYERSRLGELGPVGCVVQMTVEQRRAFLSAAQMAEGEMAVGFRRIAQTKSEVKQAIATAAALGGHLVALRPKTVNLLRPRVQRDKLSTLEGGRAETWCPTTALGSWMAEQNGQMFLTGNSWEWWHMKWLAGVWSGRPPDPLRGLGRRRKRACEVLLYRRRERRREERTGRGPRWHRLNRAVGRSYRKVLKQWRRAKDGPQRDLLARVLKDRNGHIN